ncbi:MAG TPA: toll/interleukin-1 receptor domain-containing protein [Thermoclostridium sp.]|nr:toll/interleukin-1 receptor domain-containing protein [Thermoclostridium sp.]HPU44918.1 toll/interleukin-1 receptor domain-containing protein [Thermoclostridium sp.]
MQTYKYDAFISYRHTEPDKTIADKLHRMLEAYKVPRAVVRMGSQKKVGRVFRDREELPTSSNLAESIQQALENSEHLIVICSPRTPHSQWVCKEIETFAELHGHDRILALLIEGEPEKSFPDQLRFVRKKAVREDGTETEEVRVIEPLAADIRAQSLGGMKKKLKTEILRLLAPILNCRFDDLKQRHRERKVKQALTLSFAISLFFLLFGSYSAYQAALIKEQSEVIKQKSEQVEQKSKEVEQHARMLEIQVQKTLRASPSTFRIFQQPILQAGTGWELSWRPGRRFQKTWPTRKGPMWRKRSMRSAMPLVSIKQNTVLKCRPTLCSGTTNGFMIPQ